MNACQCWRRPLACEWSRLLGGLERINPGDNEHKFETIRKIVSGQDERTLDLIAEVYGSVVTAGVYHARP